MNTITDNTIDNDDVVLNDIATKHSVEPEELKSISTCLGSQDYDKIAKTIVYMKLRTVEHKSMVDSFSTAFPERCIYGDSSHLGNFGTNKDRDNISDQAIIIKAKRLEASKIYETILGMVSSSLFAQYFVDRQRILNEALNIVFDDDVSTRDKYQYMKIFLEETRKPEIAKGLELNVNVTNKEYKQINNNMAIISKKLEGLDADKIIDVITNKKDD